MRMRYINLHFTYSLTFNKVPPALLRDVVPGISSYRGNRTSYCSASSLSQSLTQS